MKMEELQLQIICENPPENEGEVYSETNQNIDLEERKKKLFKIARNNEQDQHNNMNELERELGSLNEEDAKKVLQAKDEKENTHLHYAAKAGNLEICRHLAAKGANLNAAGENGMKILPFAARYGDGKRVDEVWKCMEFIASEIKKSESKIKCAKKKHDKSKDQESQRPVVKTENEKVLFDPHERDKYNFNILHHAIQNTNWAKNPIVVRNLIKTGNFRITDTDHQENTCLHLAAQIDKRSDDKIFDAFFEENQSIPQEDITKCINGRNDRGMTPIHIACAVGNQDTLEKLLEVCDNSDVATIINDRGKNGLLPLCHAITNKNLLMVETLLQKGAKPVEGTMVTAAKSVSINLSYLLILNKLLQDWGGQHHESATETVGLSVDSRSLSAVCCSGTQQP